MLWSNISPRQQQQKEKATRKQEQDWKTGETSAKHDTQFAAAFGGDDTGDSTTTTAVGNINSDNDNDNNNVNTGNDNNARSNNDNDNDNNNNINTNNNNTAATTTTLSSVATSVAKQPKSKRLFTKDRHQSAMIHFMDHKHKRSKPNFYAKNYLLYGSEDADPDMMRLT